MIIKPNVAIGKISGKSTWHGNFSRLTALRVTFSKKKRKTCFYIWSRRWCVLNFRSVSLLVWPIGPVLSHKPTDKLASKIRTILDRLLATRGFWLLRLDSTTNIKKKFCQNISVIWAKSTTVVDQNSPCTCITRQ